MTLTESRRPPGRPRSAEADEAILGAALAAFLEVGYQGMSIEDVATRAGVGKTTIYRRWPGKDELIAAAVSRVTEAGDHADTGSLRGDLLAVVERLRRSPLSGRTFARLVAELDANPALAPIYRDNVVRPRRAALRAVLRRGVARGELSGDVDLDLAVDMLIGPVMLRGLQEQIDPRRPALSPERLVDALLRGIAAR